MPASLPDPIVVPWTMKTLDSAVTTLDFDERGRMRASIVHDVLHGVTPEMLVWWFQNLRGTVEIEGHTHPRYRV